MAKWPCKGAVIKTLEYLLDRFYEIIANPWPQAYNESIQSITYSIKRG